MFIIFHIFIASDQALCGVRTGENNSPTLPWVTGFVESLLSGIKYSLTDLYFFKVTCTLIGGEVFWDCRPHFSSPANKLFYLGDRRERGSKWRREGRENSPPPPAFASSLSCLSRVYFSHDIPQMESLLAGSVFPRYFTGMRVNTQKLSITCIHQGPVVQSWVKITQG